MPNVKIPVDTISFTRGSMNITGTFGWQNGTEKDFATKAFSVSGPWQKYYGHTDAANGITPTYTFDASRSWTGSTGSATPNTNSLGSGSSISYMPNYIQIKLWKRLS